MKSLLDGSGYRSRPEQNLAIDAIGRPPTQWELAKTLGLKAQSAVTFHLRALAKRGVIRLCGGSRGIELVDAEPLPGQGLSLLGRVPAGHVSLDLAHP